jgi:hypothetical protein
VKPLSLCVPSLKNKGTTTPRPTPNLPKLVDHFRCYAVKPVDVPKNVQLKDQFTSTASRVGRAKRLCDPVRKDSGQVVRPDAHLVCYSITGAKHFPGASVRVRNQFGVASMCVLRPEALCLPSFKESLGTLLR